MPLALIRGTPTTWVGIPGPPDWISTPIQSRLFQFSLASSFTRGGLQRLNQPELPGAWPGAPASAPVSYASCLSHQPLSLSSWWIPAQKGWATSLGSHGTSPSQRQTVLCDPAGGRPLWSRPSHRPSCAVADSPSTERSLKTGGGLQALLCQDTGARRPGNTGIRFRRQGPLSYQLLPRTQKQTLTSLPCLER